MGKKLLVADDSVTIQKVIKLALSSEGYDILAVSEGKEAIRAIQEERPDVVLIDIALPGADAYAVKRAINANPDLDSVGFVLMASAFERVDEKLVDEVRFQGRLIKPFDPSHLRKAVSVLMTRGPATPTPPREDEDAGGDEDEHTRPSFVPEDLPPVQDMHPVVNEETFHQDTLPDMTAPPPLPPEAIIEEEKTEPDFDIEIEAAHRTLENDIKDLTESTIKMSGLDEFQWNLEDSRKMKTQTVIPPAPSMPPSVLESTKEIPRVSESDRRVSPLKTVINIPTRSVDDGGSNFPMDLMTAPPAAKQKAPTLKAPPGSDMVSGRDFVPPKVPTIELNTPETIVPRPTPAAAPAMTRAEIEQLVRADLQAVIERLAKEIVPQIAENVIRREIEKLLAET